MSQLDEARLRKSRALYKLALGDHNGSVEDVLQSLQFYSNACDQVSKAHRQDAIEKMGEAYELARQIKNKQTVLTHGEKLLYAGSRVGNLYYYPWADDPSSEEFDPEERFRDPDGYLELAPKQYELFDKWTRAKDAIGLGDWFGLDNLLYQDSLQDCSVVASLLSIANLELRTGQSVLSSRLHPWKPSNGKYHVKLHFNGTDRRVVIDDLLPSSKKPDRSLFVQSQNNMLWPALFEKAYMKVMGGYDFAGSHACLDTFYFSGWIPSYVHLSSPRQDPTSTSKGFWDIMFKSWCRGDLVACIGTGQDAREELRLIPVHDYTVLDMKEVNNERLLLIRNPWRDQSGMPTFAVEEQDVGNGSFWMDYDTIRMHFESLYLNWNPRMFKYKQALEFTWSTTDMTKSRSYAGSPQFTISNDNDQEADTMIHIARYISEFDGYMNLVVYDSDYRMMIPHSAPVVVDSASVNTSYITANLTVPPRKTLLIVLKAQDVKTQMKLLQYSFAAYSQQPVTTKRARDLFKYKCLVDGRWDVDTAGGSWASASYSKNPQFKISVTDPTPAAFYAFSDANHPLNVQVFWSRGKPIRGCITKDVLCSSEQYVIGACSAEVKMIDPGEYTAVVSTYHPGQGQFQLVAATNDKQCRIEPLKPEFAAKFCRSVSHGWDGKHRQDIPLQVERQTDAVFHLYTKQVSNEATYRPNLRISVYEGVNLISSTENFNDQVFGVYLDGTMLKKDITYIVTLERMEAGYGEYQLDVFSSDPVVFLK